MKLVAYLRGVTSGTNYAEPEKPVSYNESFTYAFKTKMLSIGMCQIMHTHPWK